MTYNRNSGSNWREPRSGFDERDDRYRNRSDGYRDQDRDDRGFFERAGDEISSWFGDDDAERRRERQCRAYVPPDHRAGDDPELAAETADEVPDLPTFPGLRAIQPRRAVRARLPAGRAVAVAPAEVPVGEGAEAFFSASSSRPFET